MRYTFFGFGNRVLDPNNDSALAYPVWITTKCLDFGPSFLEICKQCGPPTFAEVRFDVTEMNEAIRLRESQRTSQHVLERLAEVGAPTPVIATLSVKCPSCGSPPNRPCYGNGDMRVPHSVREKLARTQYVEQLRSELRRTCASYAQVQQELRAIHIALDLATTSFKENDGRDLNATNESLQPLVDEVRAFAARVRRRAGSL